MNKKIKIFATILILAASTGTSRAAEFLEDFSSWTSNPTFDLFTIDGWEAKRVSVRGTDFSDADGTPWLSSSNSPYLQTPLLTNGFGSVSFDYANNGSGTYPFTLEISTNALPPWTVIAGFTNSLASQVWTNRTFTTNIYQDVYLRIVGGVPSGTNSLGIDNFQVREAPANVTISDLYSDPPTVYVENQPHIYATLTPSALASNLSASVIYTIGSQTGTNVMTNTVGNLWRTLSPLPAQEYAVTAYYTITSLFSGTNALSPVTTSSSYVVLGVPFVTDYDTNAMIVTGSFSTNMHLIAPYLWQGILSITSPTNSAHFQFQGVHTNSGGTNIWGDAAPISTNLIVRGTAITGATAIATGPLPSGQIAFLFNEQTGIYEINDVRYNDFEQWTGATTNGTYESNSWKIVAGRIANDTRTRGRSVILSTNINANVRSPECPDGIGSISFWQRHGEDSDSPTLSECTLQVSTNGSDSSGDWVTVTNILVNSKTFRREQIVFNSRTYRFARLIRTGAPADVLIDEFMIASPGANVTMSGLTHTPASPTVSNAVSVSAQITPFREATVTNVTAWWRTAGTNSFTGIAMLKGTGNVWTVTSEIPAARGNASDGLGAGNVEYYVSADFSGYQADACSPAFLPVQGGMNPAIYTIQPASVVYSNVVHTPVRPAANTGFHVSADILPTAGAQPPVSTLYYRTGTIGGYTTVAMSGTGSNHFATSSAVPVPSHPGTPVQYYLRSTFTGPSAQSPAFFPSGGSTNPITVLTGSAALASGFSSMSATGNLSGTLRLVNNQQWRGVLSMPSLMSSPSFTIRGVGSVTNTWGDNSASSATVPIFSTAVTGQAPIKLSGTWFDYFNLVFNETNQLYSLRQVYLQNFATFATNDTIAPGVPVVSDDWTIMNANVFNTNAAFNGNTLRLGGLAVAGTNSYVQSPVISGGIGSIGFWARNLDETGIGLGDWTSVFAQPPLRNGKRLAALPTFSQADYLFYEIPYASSAGNIEVQLIWNSADNPQNAQIAVDDLTIEILSSYTTILNIAHTPPSPAFTNNVNISANISPTYATNLTATAWYRIGTSGAFTAATMTNTGGIAWSTIPPLPRTEPGVVEYYVETIFKSPHGVGPFTMTAPPAGADAPLAFTNSDVLAAFTAVTTAEGWKQATAPTSQTNNTGWIANDCYARSRTFSPPIAAIWLNEANPAASWLQTPWLAQGVGAINLENRLDSAGSAMLDVLVSTNGTDWTTNITLEIASTDWNFSTIPLNIEQGVYVRFAYNSATSRRIGFDTISVTYPLATVAISNVLIHPYYPSGTDPVYVRCNITSATAFTPAIDITARVFYKVSTVTNWSGPIEMTRDDSEYITQTPIPAFAAGQTVHYYIESTFKGYKQFYSYSPTTEPVNPNTSPRSYNSRAYASSYDVIGVDAGDKTLDLARVGNNFWEGTLEYITPHSNPYFQLKGYGLYNGTNVETGLSTTWGDDDVFRTNLPLSGTATIDGSPILIPELAEGQYVIRFDESSRTYTVQRTAFQNFDTWPASDSVFEESYAAAEIKQYPQDFDTWNLSNPNPKPDEWFEAGWTNVQQYPYNGTFDESTEAGSPAGFFKLSYGVIVTQTVGSAAMLSDTPLSGQIITTKDLNDSAGNFSFDARAAGPNNFSPAIYTDTNFTNVRITAAIQAFDLPTNTPSSTVSNSYGVAYKSLIGGFQDTNNYYEARVRQWNTTQKRFELWRRVNGLSVNLANSGVINGSITTSDSLSLHIYRASASTVQLSIYQGATLRTSHASSPLITNGFGVGVAGLDAGVAFDGITVLGIANISNTATTNILYAADFSTGTNGWTDAGGVWTVTNNTFRCPGYVGPTLSLDVAYSTDRVNWTPVVTFTNVNHSYYKRYTATPYQAGLVYMRIRHKEGTGNIVIDNIRNEVWRGKTVSSDSWMATNAWITSGKSGNGLELRGSRALPGDKQFIQTPVVSNGVAVISFDYKSVTGTNDQLIFALDYTHTSAPSSWLSYLEVTNNLTLWQNFSHSIERELRPQIYRMRIRNASASPAAGILLDNIKVTEPAPINDFTWWGYNVLVSDKQTTRIAPITDNIKGAYLNNGPGNGTASGIAYTSYYPFIQSAYLPGGVGEISFWYRAWDTTPSGIEVVAATNRLQPESQWTVLTNVPATNTTFAYFSHKFYDRDNRYVKLRINTSTGTPGRVAIDNLRISAPFASDLRLKNLRLIPAIPLFTDSVLVSVQADQFFFNPSNITMKMYFREGTNNWGDHSSSVVYNMVLVDASDGTLTYQTLDTIPATAIDKVVQYQVETSFDGFFSQYSSPKRYQPFINPTNYWPVDLNHNQPLKTPYYYSFSSLPGQVWINEFNIADLSTWGNAPAGQFIEIVGKGNVSINKWRLESINTDFTTNAAYTFTSGDVLGSASNAYGFIVFGQNDITERNRDLTNTLPMSGGLQLVRSMGAIEQQVSYDEPYVTTGEQMISPDNRYVYAGVDHNWVDGAMTLIGTGSNSTDFVWWAPEFLGEDRAFSIGTNNVGQTLIPWPDSSPDPEDERYTGTVSISKAWRVGPQISMEVDTQSVNLTPKPWYATNLMNISWTEVPSPAWSRTGTTYNVSFPAITNAPRAFYTITVTGTD